MTVDLHPDAERELADAAVWYETRGPGLGMALLAEVTRLLATISSAPLARARWPGSPRLDPPIRRALTQRFPYAIAYQASPQRILVLAFAHTSRKPLYWKARASR